MSIAKQSAIAIWAVSHSALYGYHIGSFNGIQESVVCDGTDRGGHWGLKDCLDVSDNAFGVAVTIFTLGGLVGSLSADTISRRFDRVGTLRIAEIGFIIAAVAIALANQLWAVILGRILVGVSSGLVLVTIPPFLTQIAPKKYQTVFGTLHQSSIGLGMVCAQSLSLALARPFWWRGELIVAVAIGVVLLLAGGLIRSSAGEEDDTSEDGPAREETALLRDRERKEPISVKSLLTTSDISLWRGFFVVCVAQFAQQICGISPVMFFSSRILKPVFGGNSKLVVLGIMGIGIPFNFVPGILPSSIGSKRLLITSALGTSLTALLLAIGLNTHNQALSGAAVIGFVISFSIGLAPIAWVVLSEVVPPEARTAVGSIAVGVNWLTNFSAGTAFLPLQEYLQTGSEGEGNIFYVFSGASLLAAVGIWSSYRLYERSVD